MKQITKTLVGIRRFHSVKKDKDYAVLLLNVPFTDREISNGCSGLNIEEVFVPDDLMGLVSSLKVGNTISFDYEVQGQRAFIVGFNQV